MLPPVWRETKGPTLHYPCVAPLTWIIMGGGIKYVPPKCRNLSLMAQTLPTKCTAFRWDILSPLPFSTSIPVHVVTYWVQNWINSIFFLRAMTFPAVGGVLPISRFFLGFRGFWRFWVPFFFENGFPQKTGFWGQNPDFYA